MLTKMASGRKTDGKTHHCAPENSIIMTFGQIGAKWTIGSAQERIQQHRITSPQYLSKIEYLLHEAY